MKLVKGIAFPDADVFMAAQVQPDGRYQGAHLDEALRYVTDFSVAVDGGAHVGLWSRALAMRFTRVLAFEPALDTFEALEENLQEYPNVERFTLALGSGDGHVSMVLDAKNEARANTGARYVQLDGKDELPNMIALDLLGLSSLGFLKLDVEGCEYPALLGAHQTIQRCRPIVLFEDKGFGARFGVRPGAIEFFLTGLGYMKRAQLSADQIWGPA